MKKLIVSVLAMFGIVFAAQAAVGASVGPAAFNVNVTLTPTCQLTTPPGNITLNYTSFATATSASTPFTVTCTNTLPYTMALSTANADTLGLTIPLAIRNAGDTVDVAGATSAGTAASYLIKASVAQQSGTCTTATCTSSVARTLTISY